MIFRVGSQTFILGMILWKFNQNYMNDAVNSVCVKIQNLLKYLSLSREEAAFRWIVILFNFILMVGHISDEITLRLRVSAVHITLSQEKSSRNKIKPISRFIFS